MESYLDWIKKVSADTDIVPLYYVADFRISPIDKIKYDDEVPVKLCNYVDVYKNAYITSDIEFMEGTATENEIERFTIKDGDVIITKDSESSDDIGIPAIVKGDFKELTVCGYHLALISPKKGKIIPKFLYYCFESKQHRLQIEIESTGVTRVGIPKDVISHYKIPLKSLAQQNKIVGYLDQEVAIIDALMEKKIRLVELLEEKKKATISQAVTKGLDPNAEMKPSGIEWLGDIPEHWEVIRLKHVVNKIDDYSENVSELKLAVENIESFTGRLINIENTDYDSSLNKFKKGDVIFNKLRPYLGKVYYAEQDGGVYGELLVLRGNPSIYSKFLFYLLISHKFIELVDSSSTGTKMPRANWEDFIKNINIPQIPYSEQQLIANELDRKVYKIEQLKNKLYNSIHLLKEKRTAIISAAINGELNL